MFYITHHLRFYLYKHDIYFCQLTTYIQKYIGDVIFIYFGTAHFPLMYFKVNSIYLIYNIKINIHFLCPTKVNLLILYNIEITSANTRKSGWLLQCLHKKEIDLYILLKKKDYILYIQILSFF